MTILVKRISDFYLYFLWYFPFFVRILLFLEWIQVIGHHLMFVEVLGITQWIGSHVCLSTLIYDIVQKFTFILNFSLLGFGHNENFSPVFGFFHVCISFLSQQTHDILHTIFFTHLLQINFFLIILLCNLNFVLFHFVQAAQKISSPCKKLMKMNFNQWHHLHDSFFSFYNFIFSQRSLQSYT